MAYCLKCGAYIPDGQTACLACGYDPAEEQKKEEAAKAPKSRRSSSAAAQQTSTNNEMRSRLEEQRRRAQEQNRQWAEQERRRREQAAAREAARKEQQEKDRQWAQEQYEKRQAEKRAAAESSGGAQSFGEYYRPHTQSSGGNKALAAVSYLSILFALPYLFAPNDEFARFHARQGLKLFVFGIVADILGTLIGFGWLVTLVRLYLIYKGMTNALNGKKEELPWIGNLSLGEK
ncbi:MAG: hypothetical protein IKS55_14985 [Oscillospiraceae bacterium]|nr:hypothetical protein [Oscillospiraceae bacterium]